MKQYVTDTKLVDQFKNVFIDHNAIETSTDNE